MSTNAPPLQQLALDVLHSFLLLSSAHPYVILVSLEVVEIDATKRKNQKVKTSQSKQQYHILSINKKLDQSIVACFFCLQPQQQTKSMSNYRATHHGDDRNSLHNDCTIWCSPAMHSFCICCFSHIF